MPIRILAIAATCFWLATAARAQDEPANPEPAKSTAEAKPEAAKPEPAKPEPAKPAKPAADSPPVAAFVNGEPIYVAEVDRNYETISQQKSLDPARVDRSKAEVMTQLVNRILVTQALKRLGTVVSEKEIDDALREQEENFREKFKMNAEQFARAQGITVDTLRRDLFWQFAWDRYLERNLADAMQGYFERNKKELDGTLVRASHILIRPEKYNEPPTLAAARAKKIRAAIEAGKMTFEQAALRYSAGPSRDRGGDLGFFPRHGVMSENFAKAAFALEANNISEPVVTPFGTHLIRVTQVRPGSRQWTQVIPQIKNLASAELLENMAEVARETAKIEYTGKSPYFQPDTDELVVPPAK